MKLSLILIARLSLMVMILTAVPQAEEPAPVLPFKTPATLSQFNPLFHFPPVNQDTTNACWSFATLSYIESEINRQGDTAVKLSVMFPVYYAFLEKAKQFVATRGESRLMPGDLFPTVIDIIQTYGIVPEAAYHGQTDTKPIYNHKAMEQEIEDYKQKIMEKALWDETAVIAKIRQILDFYLGEPPATFKFNEETFTPLSFASTYVNLSWEDYILVTSFSYAPFWSFIVLDVPDNWRHKDTYYNVPLDVFYKGLVSALTHGYSVAIDGDIGEPGRLAKADVCFIPAYDIPTAFIDQSAREYRFIRKITTDDHLMQMVGYVTYEDQTWFLVKDSWRDAWEGAFKGYFLFHEDYVRLKVLAYLVHKDAIPGIWDKLKGEK